MKAIRIHNFGGPDEMVLEDVPVPVPAAGQVRVRNLAMGVNFVDTRMRGGMRPFPLPMGIGLDAVGVVDALGEGVTGYAVGDRVGYYLGPPGAYAEQHVVAVDHLFPVPDDIPDAEAVTLMTKGVTAQYLLHRAHKVVPGYKIMVQAAAGGVGRILTQWAKALGATVVGGVGSDDKMEIARADGCDLVVNTRKPGWVDEVKQFVGEGVDVVYDSVGKDTYEGSLDILRVRGALVFFGASSGPAPALDMLQLGARGSFNVMYASGYHFSRDAAEIQDGMANVFAAYKAGHIKPKVHAVMKLEQAAEAHHLLEGRATTGGLVLVP